VKWLNSFLKGFTTPLVREPQRHLDSKYLITPTDTAMLTQRKPEDPNPKQAGLDRINVTTRYDVYCKEQNQDVIYRNARFKGRKGLFPGGDDDVASEFIELEQADGETIFIPRSSLVKFCPPGVKPDSECSPW